MIIPLVTFLICFGVIYSAYWGFVLRPEAQAAGVVHRRLKKDHLKVVARSQLLKQVRAMSSIGAVDAILKRGRSRTERLQILIEQAGLKMTVATLLAGSAALGALAFYIAQRFGVWTSVALGAAALAALAPVNVVKYMRTLRMRKFEEQFPEALDLLGRALRAGHAFTTGVEMVGTEMPDPIGPEFRILYDQQNYGMPLPDALRLFGERIPVIDARFFVTAVLIQRESGGNLSEVLDNLAHVIRERFRVKRQIRVISAHGRITGWILVCLPPVLALVLFTINTETRELMFYDPLGQQMMVVAIVLQIIGTLIMRKIINVEY
ncbi:MAG: type II secretion system F family protein [Vicinamibacterales bacterium]